MPAAGEIVCFNRSHYEDVLVLVVSSAIDEAETTRRYAHINDFERLLAETGAVVLKFLLHVSKDEQRKRLQQRIDDPAKRWKFQRGDLDVRKAWDAYRQAYQRAIAATAPWAPWHVIPADSKSNRDLMVALQSATPCGRCPALSPTRSDAAGREGPLSCRRARRKAIAGEHQIRFDDGSGRVRAASAGGPTRQ